MKNKRICGRHLVHWGACGRNLALIGVAALLVTACADEDLANKDNNKTNGTAVCFHVADVQNEALAKSAVGMTRGLGSEPILSADLAAQKLAVKGSGAQDMCIIESTVEGVNPVKMDAKTRAEVTTLSNLQMFSSSGYRGASPTGISQTPNWFYSEDTNPDGTLLKRYDWDWPINTYARFYAIHPKVTAAHGMVLSNNSYVGAPQVTFTVNPDVTQQQDFMTACSGDVHYVHGNDPTTNLKFRHALTAIKFAIGENLSFAYITKIEIRNAIVKGKYTLADNLEGTRPVAGDNGWTMNDADRGNVSLTLAAPGVSTVGAVNSVIVGKPGQNYVFYMIPQKVKGKHVEAVITLSGGQTITADLKADWKAGTTKVLKLSQANSGLQYYFTATLNSLSFDYTDGESKTKAFKVLSWREGIDPATGLTYKQAVNWKVIKYDVYDGSSLVYSGSTKPAWLTTITESGTGADGAEEIGYVAVRAKQGEDIYDHLPDYNAEFQKEANRKGSAGNYWNLSNPDTGGNDIIETANCYLISGPGHYRFPLVYGNAIVNKATNTNAFQSKAPVTPYGILSDIILHKFKDHANNDINFALINEQNSSKKATKASIVWEDHPNLIQGASLHISSYPTLVDGITKNVDFVEFEVKKADIHNGNAIIAVKNDDGTVMWSWHLWFDHQDALDKIKCKNSEGTTYNFTRNTLGGVYLKYIESLYTQPRRVEITIEQQASNSTKARSTISVTQNSGHDRLVFATHYQFARKDALPGTNNLYDGNSSSPNASLFTSIYNSYSLTPQQSIGTTIQHPNTYYGVNSYPPDVYDHTYANLWSANNAAMEKENYNNTKPIVKTIYDPCPAGFHVPDRKAFKGFHYANTNGWDHGWNFYRTSSGSPNRPTIYFPAAGMRAIDGSLAQVGDYGYYWTALPQNEFSAGVFTFYQFDSSTPGGYDTRVLGYCVRPVADTKTKVTPKAPGSTEEQWGSEQQVGGTEIDLDN